MFRIRLTIVSNDLKPLAVVMILVLIDLFQLEFLLRTITTNCSTRWPLNYACAWLHDTLLCVWKDTSRPTSNTNLCSNQAMADNDTLDDNVFMFRKEQFHRIVDTKQLYDLWSNTQCRQPDSHPIHPAELYVLAVLQKIVFPCWFIDLADNFGIPDFLIFKIFYSIA